MLLTLLLEIDLEVGRSTLKVADMRELWTCYLMVWQGNLSVMHDYHDDKVMRGVFREDSFGRNLYPLASCLVVLLFLFPPRLACDYPSWDGIRK